MSHVDPNGSYGRSRSWGGSRRSQSPMVDGSCASRYEANQSMRERAAELWLREMRQAQERREETLQRRNHIDHVKRERTEAKIRQHEECSRQQQERRREYLRSRSDAFQGRQEYLGQARSHSRLMHQLRSQQVGQEVETKLSIAEQNHQRAVQQRAAEAARRNIERQEAARRNQQLLSRRKEAHVRGAEMTSSQKEAEIEYRRRREEEERLAAAEEKEAQRQQALRRAENYSAMKRMTVEAKLYRDEERSSSVLRRREEWLKERQMRNIERQQQAEMSVAHAQRVRKAKEKMYENHFEESLAIGRETAEHNKMFKLNNRVMHELMKDMISDAKSQRSRSSFSRR